jgi:hypothetical protein
MPRPVTQQPGCGISQSDWRKNRTDGIGLYRGSHQMHALVALMFQLLAPRQRCQRLLVSCLLPQVAEGTWSGGRPEPVQAGTGRRRRKQVGSSGLERVPWVPWVHARYGTGGSPSQSALTPSAQDSSLRLQRRPCPCFFGSLEGCLGCAGATSVLVLLLATLYLKASHPFPPLSAPPPGEFLSSE